jgi:hypothetical protein
MLRFVMMLLSGGTKPSVRCELMGSADCDDAGCFDSGVCSAREG